MSNSKELLLLAVEGGATRTHWRMYQLHKGEGKLIINEGILGCGNWKALPLASRRALLSSLPKNCGIVGIFLAGCATDQDQTALKTLCQEIWPSVRIVVGSDRDSGFRAAFREKEGILVIAGTGSAVTGKKGKQIEIAAGWGKLLGDPGSGFALSVQALREALRQFDLERTISPFLKSILEKLKITSVRELTEWAEQAEKSDLAELTSVLFTHKADPEIQAVLASGASLLAGCCHAVANRLKEERPHIRLMGGIFTHHPEYVELFREALSRHLPGAQVELSREPGVEGAAWFALQNKDVSSIPTTAAPNSSSLASTEEKNPRSQGWEAFSTPRLVQLFVDEEACVQEALQGAVDSLSCAIDAISQKIFAKGRLFYVGAGTSGRLGVLDAAEIPPTFGVSPDRIQSILAGGVDALIQSAEAKEDDEKLAIEALREKKLTSKDVVCAITASGTTPFAWGAIHEARRIGAFSLLITCTKQPMPPGPDIEIRLLTGPELLAGSTRLKAGTATKVALNILSTGVMIRLGRVRDNSMAYLHPSNRKLRQRAVRILSETLQISESEALKKLESADWDISTALKVI